MKADYLTLVSGTEYKYNAYSEHLMKYNSSCSSVTQTVKLLQYK